MSFDLKIERGDIALNRDGTVKTVSDNEKLRQDIIKILLTKPGENKYHPQYGSNVGVLEIGFVADKEVVELDLKSSVESAIKKLILLQKEQAKRQYLSPGEVILAIKSVRTERDTADPRMYNIFISVVTQKLTTITEAITIRII